ncbi:MAG: hypothetical protein ACXWU1_11210 [Allosphingosinicella sp.]
MGFAFAAISLLAAANASSRPIPDYSLETISREPTAQLAQQLLGREAAVDVESHEVIDGGLVHFLAGVRFFHRPRPLAADICGRRVHYVSFAAAGPAAPDSSPPQRVSAPGSVRESLEIALAPQCRLAPGQRFSVLNAGVSQETAVDALRAGAALSSAARGPDAVMFSVTCRDELGQAACGIDGRETLAAVPIDRAWLIEPDPNVAGWVRVVVGEPGQVYWELRFPGGTTAPAELVMTRKVPALF